MSDNREKEPVSPAEQPPPVPNDRVPVWDAVIARMHDRDRIGQERYKTRLQAGNGRDALRDALEEALDQCAYLEQAAQDRDDDKREIERLRAALEDEKRRRIYYQSIVHAVCLQLNRAFGRRHWSGEGVVCGTADNPSTQVQDLTIVLVDDILRC